MLNWKKNEKIKGLFPFIAIAVPEDQDNDNYKNDNLPHAVMFCHSGRVDKVVNQAGLKIFCCPKIRLLFARIEYFLLQLFVSICPNFFWMGRQDFSPRFFNFFYANFFGFLKKYFVPAVKICN